ncbi:MAG: HAD-IA family hydrolase [Acidimicrobiia bacterium]|nr:HAD-IA family hydrolase [Acidimicrobiia bacterium]
MSVFVGLRLGRLLGVLVLAALVTTSCRADLSVDVDVAPDGSGLVRAEVVIDAEAAGQLLDLDRESGGGIPTRDLVEAGWDLEPPVRGEDGSVTVTATKAFGTTSQFTEVMSELSGDSGLIRNFTLVRAQSFGRLDYTVSGVVDPINGFSSFTDADLETSLTRSLESIAERYGADEQDVTIELSVTLPGELQEDQSNGLQPELTETGATLHWETSLAAVNRTDVLITTTRRAITAQVLRGVAVLAAVLSGLLIFARLLRLIGSWRRPKEPKRPRPADALGRRPDEQRKARAARTAQDRKAERTADEEAAEAADRRYGVVALDGMGVLYREGDDIAELLVPFARQRGSEVPSDEIAAKARLMSLGRMTSTQFWPSIGVEGDPNELDAAYLSLHQLSPGVVKYLRKLRSEGVKAACVTNDAAEWATKLRTSHSLQGLIDPWVVSGSVGVRKPAAPIFEVLRRVTGEPPASILIVDDDIDTLDAARKLGFGTVWFTATGDREQARGHEVWRRFDTDDEELSIETAAAVTGEITQPDTTSG